MSAALQYVCRKISKLEGVEWAGISDLGAIQVVLAGGLTSDTRHLREDILDIGSRAMCAVQVFYRMPDGNIIGEESKDPIKQEWVDDFYKPLIVPGFLGTTSEAPPEEVSKEIKGAMKLRRVRASTRGQPVVAWRLGTQEVRAGTHIKFNKETALQWTMNRSLTVRPGAMAKVDHLSSRRPIAFVRIGDYNDIELPIHMLGHFFSVIPNETATIESRDDKAAKKQNAKAAKAQNMANGYSDVDADEPSEFHKLMNVIGLAKPVGWGRDPEKDNVPGNQPFWRDGWIARSQDNLDDDKEWEEEVSLEEAREEAEEDMLLPPKHAQRNRKPFKSRK